MFNDKLIVKEDYKIFDKLANEMNHSARGPLGWVQIYLQTKNGLIFDEGPNLVTAQGREYVAQRVFNSSKEKIKKIEDICLKDITEKDLNTFINVLSKMTENLKEERNEKII